MRSEDFKMITPKIKELIENNPLALATINSDNTPHNIVVGDVKVISKNQIIPADNYMVKTLSNIQNNKHVSLAVFNTQEGYELIGTAEYFSSGNWLEQVKKIHKGFPAKGAIVVTIKNIKKLS